MSGADAVLQRPDGVRELDARMIWQTDEGARLYVTCQGQRAKMPVTPPPWLAEELANEFYHVITLHVQVAKAVNGGISGCLDARNLQVVLFAVAALASLAGQIHLGGWALI